jgi:hypothetical protein
MSHPSDEVVRVAISWARKAWDNTGSDGETVWLLCAAIERLVSDRDAALDGLQELLSATEDLAPLAAAVQDSTRRRTNAFTSARSLLAGTGTTRSQQLAEALRRLRDSWKRYSKNGTIELLSALHAAADAVDVLLPPKWSQVSAPAGPVTEACGYASPTRHGADAAEQQVESAKANVNRRGGVVCIASWGDIGDIDAAMRYFDGARRPFNSSPQFVQDSDAQLLLWLRELKRLRALGTSKAPSPACKFCNGIGKEEDGRRCADCNGTGGAEERHCGNCAEAQLPDRRPGFVYCGTRGHDQPVHEGCCQDWGELTTSPAAQPAQAERRAGAWPPTRLFEGIVVVPPAKELDGKVDR